MMTPATKFCPACQQDKRIDPDPAVSEFNQCSSDKTGYYYKCKECKRTGRWVKYELKKPKGRPMKEAAVASCDSCKFLKDCQREIWRLTFIPYCFIESRYHRQFVKAYGKQAEARA